MNFGVCLDFKLSSCAPAENGNGSDRYCPMDFVSLRRDWSDPFGHVQLAGRV